MYCIPRDSIRALTDSEKERYAKLRGIASVHVPWVRYQLSRLRPVYAENLGTWGSDQHGRVYLSFEGWAGTWSEEECAWALIHELFHYLRGHIPRVKESTLKCSPDIWGRATDMEINDDLVRIKGLPSPKPIVLPMDSGFEDGHLAEYYAKKLLEQGQDSGQSGGEGPEGAPGDPGQGTAFSKAPDNGTRGMCGTGVGPEAEDAADEVGDRISEEERSALERRMAEDALRHESKSPGSVPSGMIAWANERLRPPQVHWTREFAQVLGGAASKIRGHHRPSWYEPNRRTLGTLRMPGHRANTPYVLIAVDSSGSMLDGSLERATDEATGILRTKGVKPHHVQVMEVEYVVTSVRRMKTQTLTSMESSGGGTDMRKAYTAVAEMRKGRPNLMVLLTDGETPWPSEADKPHGVTCVAGIITSSRESFDRLSSDIPSWVKAIYIPRDDVRLADAR